MDMLVLVLVESTSGSIGQRFYSTFEAERRDTYPFAG